jgi:hypothetical protein
MFENEKTSTKHKRRQYLEKINMYLKLKQRFNALVGAPDLKFVGSNLRTNEIFLTTTLHMYTLAGLDPTTYL